MSKILSSCLCFVLIVGCGALGAEYGGGDGSAEEPCEIGGEIKLINCGPG